MQSTLLLSLLLIISISFSASAQKQVNEDLYGNFSIVSSAQTQEVPASRGLILIKPVVRLGSEILTCDSAYFTLSKKFEAFGHVNLRKSDGKIKESNYLSVDIFENSLYDKRTFITK